MADPEITIETTSTEATNSVTPVISMPVTPVTSTSLTSTTDMATTNDYINNCIWNLSSTPITEAQVSLLVHGPNFAVALRHLLWGIYHCNIAACLKLEPHNAEELRAEMRGALRHSQEPERNITKQEVQALVELKIDQSRVILTADKGVAIVIMDKVEYKEKAQILLEDKGKYKTLKTDPTNRMKTKLINLLKKIKLEGGH